MDVSRSKVVVLVMVFFPARMVVMMTVIVAVLVAVLVVVVCTKQPSACEINQQPNNGNVRWCRFSGQDAKLIPT